MTIICPGNGTLFKKYRNNIRHNALHDSFLIIVIRGHVKLLYSRIK